MDHKSYEYSRIEKRHSPRTVTVLAVTLSLVSLCGVLMVSLCVYQVTLINEMSAKIRAHEDDIFIIKDDLEQLKSATSNSITALDSKTQDSIIAFKSETEATFTQIFSYVDTNVKNIVNICWKEMKTFENGVLEFVNESLQNTSELIDSIEGAVEIFLRMTEEVEKEMNLTEVKIEQIVQTMRKIRSKIVSLESQVHHPVTPYRNCEVEIRNSTCNSTIDGDNTTSLCSTHPSPLEVKGSYLLDYHCSHRAYGLDSIETSSLKHSNGHFWCECQQTEPNTHGPCYSVAVRCPN